MSGTASPVTQDNFIGVEESPTEGVRVSDSTTGAEKENPGAEAQGEGADALGFSPEDFAGMFHMALRVEDLGRARTVQTDGGILGGSDALSCHAKAVYTVRGERPSNVPKKGKAQRGTYLHEGTLRAMGAVNPNLTIEVGLTATLPSGLKVPLHPDVLDPDEPSATDLKFVDDLDRIMRQGPSDNQMAQRNLQYLAGIQAGLLPEQGITRNLYVDCTDLDRVWVHQTPFDMEWVERADEWFVSVAKAVRDGEDGYREWPEPMCRDFCPFFDICRPPMFELNQPIGVPELAQTALLAFEAREQRKHWQAVEEQSVEQLKGVSGIADGRIGVKSTWVNSGKGYYKVELREVGA